jgi:hypothetical protein
MPVAALEVEIINKVTNLGAFAEEKAAMGSLFQGGVYGQGGGGGGIFMGAPGSGAAVEGETKKAGAAFKEYETNLKNAVIVSGEAGSVTDGLARKMSALGSLGFTPASLALVGVVIGLAGLVGLSKSVIDISEQEQVAQKNLAQAYATLGEKIPTQAIQDFITKNEKFLPSVAATEEGFAALARAGFDDSMQLRLMGDALDLAAAKSISLSAAITILTSSSTGMSRGLLELGISQKDINAAMGKGSTEAERYQALLALLELRAKGARETNSNLAQSQNTLNIEWERFATKIGPSASDTFTTIENAGAGVISILSKQVDLVTQLHNAWVGFSTAASSGSTAMRQRGFIPGQRNT